MKLATRLTALSLAALLAGAASAQTTGQTEADRAANSTGNTTSQQEMNRGVPGVDADVGRNAQGAIDVDTDRNTDARNLPGASNNPVGNDTMSGNDPMRAPRADRN